jgi:hypothetical protein
MTDYDHADPMGHRQPGGLLHKPSASMTLEELYLNKPRGEVIIKGEEIRNTYKAFVCHGCQTCGFGAEYPHYLSIQEIPDETQPVEATPGVPVAVPPVGD